MKKYLIILIIFIGIIGSVSLIFSANPSGQYVNITIDLSDNDNGNWVGTSQINSMSYNSNLSKIYFGTNNNGLYGYFDENLNTSINLSKGNFLAGQLVNNILFAKTFNRVYIAFHLNGLYGYFDENLNNTILLNGTDAGNFVGSIDLYAITYNDILNRTYYGGSGGLFFYFDENLNASIDLSDKDADGFFDGTVVRELSYDSITKRVYGVGDAIFFYFDENLNVSINVPFDGNWINNYYIYSLAFCDNNKTYFGTVSTLGDVKYGVFDGNINKSIELFGDDWIISGDSIYSMSCDNSLNRTYMLMGNGKYGYFDEDLNVSIDLSNTDLGNWTNTTTSLLASAFNNILNRTYFGGINGVYGYYTPSTPSIIPSNLQPTIINNYTDPLTPTYGNPFNITVELNGTELNDVIMWVNFSIIASNGTTLLNNINGTHTRNGNTYNFTSPTFIADDGGVWRWNYTAKENTSSNLVSRTGQFTISDTTKPTAIITYPVNNTPYLISNLNLNFSITDDLTKSYGSFNCWYWFNQTGNNITLSNCNNITLNSLAIAKYNITLFVNDTFGNIGSTYVNFSIEADTSSPIITITEPSGTKSSGTIPLNIIITDNVAVEKCMYNVTNFGQTLIYETNLSISNSYNGYLKETYSTGLTYYFRLWCNDTSGNSAQSTSNFAVSISPGTTPPGGGGTSTTTLVSLGQPCDSNSDCLSELCDLSVGSTKYETCVETLCGNGVKEEGENILTCSQDTTAFGGSGELSPFIKYGFYIILLLLVYFVLFGEKQRKKWIEKLRSKK